jgi:Phosphoenolpyruvate hydrolase-like
MAGGGSHSIMMPYGDANAIVMEMAREVLPVVKHTPLLAGVCGTDPFRLMKLFLREVDAAGFSGVQNFQPPATLLIQLVVALFQFRQEGANFAQCRGHPQPGRMEWVALIIVQDAPHGRTVVQHQLPRGRRRRSLRGR